MGDAAAHQAQLDEAYRRGFHEGETAGRAAVDAAVQKLAHSVESLATARARARREAEDDLLRLALAIARRILHRELTVDPEAVAGLIRAALDKIQSQEIHRVRVHPDLEQPVRQALERMAAGRNVQVAADRGREFGDVVFETARGSLDASVETQLQEIGRGLADRLRGRA
jgi:flagellar assembly protein FliH